MSDNEPFDGVGSLPNDPENMNNDRARWAQRTLETFSIITGADYEDCLSDLLSDMMHLCDRDKELGNFNDQLERARGHYNAETMGSVHYTASFSGCRGDIEADDLDQLRTKIIEHCYDPIESDRQSHEVKKLIGWHDDEPISLGASLLKAFNDDLDADMKAAIENGIAEADHVAEISSPESTGRI